MKRACLAAMLVLAAGLDATAQTRGDAGKSEAPVRSFTPAPSSPGTSHFQGRTSSAPPPGTRSFIPVRHRTNFLNGIPPQCATSGIFPLVPSAMGCTDTRFTGGPVNLWPQVFYGWDGYAPYTYPAVESPAASPEPEPEPEPPAPTIFERRPTVAPPRSTGAGTSENVPHVEQPGPAKSEPQIPTVLIFRDGHQTEVLNYAIVGQTLYDLGTFVAHKIPLSDLNLEATIKANQERGVEFNPPASGNID